MESLRPLLTTYAYNITGSLEEAKDIVQDAYLHYVQADRGHVRDEKAYLVRTVINRSINRKKQQQLQAADYPGEWLPEPVSTESADSSLLRGDMLSYSLMVLLEKLNPRQRAVFILREAFDYDHAEIAATLNISEDYSRLLLTRARKQLDAPVIQAHTGTDIRKYQDAIIRNDLKKLEQLLNEDITVISDGGGKVSAAINPVSGRTAAMAMLLGLYKKAYMHFDLRPGEVNNQPAILHYYNGELIGCQVFTFLNGAISNVFIIRNPDKLRHLKKNPA
ncbi:sigma-70 family RNA polymerase sigma factor [Chitinophaga sp. YIM B06452]|uniref:sigma-70 family RNA polymerase sigma factor n=1 Tax=Chitinophaga sp. YIM B06452 TaxID=3082158 RepID=UPI0031FF058B